MQESISQEPTRSKTQQDLEQRAVPGRVRLHGDKEEDKKWSCRDQHRGPQCLVRESQGLRGVGFPNNTALASLCPIPRGLT